MTQQSNANIQGLNVGKARKREGYYICPVTFTENKLPFTVTFEDATIVEHREKSNTIIIKCKGMVRFMDNLNEAIMDIVRENSGSWFNTKLDDDLIDEYYISTLQYDKKKGETIRMKVNNIDEIEENYKDSKVLLSMTLKYVKFYKQKFFPEFQVDSIEHIENSQPIFIDDSDDEFIDDEEDLPLPSFEEIQQIKNDCLKSLYTQRTHLEETFANIAIQMTKNSDNIDNLENCKDVSTIMKLCEEYQITI